MTGPATLVKPPTLQFKEFHGTLLEHKAPADGQEDYIREVLVAVTGNTDDGGDVIQPKAFHFKRHPKIVWSHDLKVLVAKVLAYEEWLPGDPRLPADLQAKGLGALWFQVEFDPLDPESYKAFRKVVFHQDLGWSIGYEVDPKGFKMLPDGRRALTKVYVWEGSPTTFGMNQEARTLNVKSAIDQAVKDLDLPAEKATALVDLVALLAKPEVETEEKSYPALEGSFEETQDRLRDAANAYGIAVYGERSEENDWWCSIEGTFDDAVVVTFRFYGGTGENATLRFPYTDGEDGAVLLGDPEEVEVRATVAPSTGTAPATEETTTAVDTEEGKTALEDLDVKGVLDTLEEVKKGRVLSAANAASLAAAAEAISKVLAAAAPKDDEEDKTPKAKKDDEEAKPKAKDEKVLAREIVPKGQGGTVEVEVPEGAEALEEKDLIEMLALANS